MTPDEVRMLDNQYALLFIRGERPVRDLKYDLLKHPNIAMTSDGDAEPYIHGGAKNAKFTISLTSDLSGAADAEGIDSGGYELLSEEDIANEYE